MDQLSMAQTIKPEPEFLTLRCQLTCKDVNDQEKNEAIDNAIRHGSCVSYTKFGMSDFYVFKLKNSSVSNIYTENSLGANRYDEYNPNVHLNDCSSTLDPSQSLVKFLTMFNGSNPETAIGNMGAVLEMRSTDSSKKNFANIWSEIPKNTLDRLRICEINRIKTYRIYKKETSGEIRSYIKTETDRLYRNLDDAGSYEYKDFYVHGPNIIDTDKLANPLNSKLDSAHFRIFGDYIPPKVLPGSIDSFAAKALEKFKLEKKCD